MKLINFDNFEIKPADELLLIKQFRDLLHADKSKKKEKFFQLCSVIYFYADPRSTYSYITDDKERLNAIILQEGLDKDFKIDSKLQEAIDIYKKHTLTSSALLLQDTKVTIEKIRSMLKSLDFDMMEEKDKVTAIKNVTSIVSLIPKLVKDLTDAEKSLTLELAEAGRLKGNREKTIFDDGF